MTVLSSAALPPPRELRTQCRRQGRSGACLCTECARQCHQNTQPAAPFTACSAQPSLERAMRRDEAHLNRMGAKKMTALIPAQHRVAGKSLLQLSHVTAQPKGRTQKD